MIFILILLVGPISYPTLTAYADDTKPSTQPTKTAKPIILKRLDDKANGHRIPAKPIYGYYDGQILTIAFDCDNDQSVTLHVYSETSSNYYYFTTSDLIQGVDVDIYESDSIELLLEDGTKYSEII